MQNILPPPSFLKIKFPFETKVFKTLPKSSKNNPVTLHKLENNSWNWRFSFPFLQYFDEFSFFFHKLTGIFCVCLPCQCLSLTRIVRSKIVFTSIWSHILWSRISFEWILFWILFLDLLFHCCVYFDVLFLNGRAFWRRARVTNIVTRFFTIKTTQNGLLLHTIWLFFKILI